MLRCVLENVLSTRILLASLVITVSFNEFLVYILQPYYWPQLECYNNDTTCTKILFVADAQILGDEAVEAPLKYLYNWDSDRYLSLTYRRALQYFRPNVVIFLGDNMDEGSIATSEQYQSYLRRLADIFGSEYELMHIWIPGDNDIGGENEPVYINKVRDFQNTFHQPDVISFNNITVYKVNRINYSMPKLPEGHTVEKEKLNIIVTHMPLLGSGVFAKKVLEELHASIVFSAHHHISKHITRYNMKDSPTPQSQFTLFEPGAATLTIKIRDEVYNEIIVPTCSYRMGVDQMGYGAAIFDHHNQNLRYNVLWSPGRFSKLHLYLYILIVIFLIFLYTVIFRWIFRFNLVQLCLDCIFKSDLKARKSSEVVWGRIQ